MVMKMRDMMQRKNGQKGFTLIELIVVMAILAVLAAIAVPRYTGILSASKEKANVANQTLIEKSAELYIAQDETLPATIDAIVTAGYLKEVPVNPATGNKPGYTCAITATGEITVADI